MIAADAISMHRKIKQLFTARKASQTVGLHLVNIHAISPVWHVFHPHAYV